MNTELRAALITAGSSFIAALIPVFFMYEANNIALEQLTIAKEQAERQRDTAEYQAQVYRRQIGAAQTRFTERLGMLIDEASAEARRTEGPSELLEASRALVSARNGFRSSLDSVGQRMDSEIDQLEKELASPSPDLNRISQLVNVLKRKWPAKKEEIDLASRKLLTELGLVPQGDE